MRGFEMNGEAQEQEGPPSQVSLFSLFNLRLVIGFAQGICAWALLELLPKASGYTKQPDVMQWWPYRHPGVFAALCLIVAILPVIALAEVGRMAKRPLAIYLAVACAVLASLAGYDIWRDPVENGWGAATNRIWPSFTLMFCAGIGTFIVNQLLEHKARGASLWSRYADHFEDSWMRAFQFLLSLIFTALVWGVIELGRALFGLIHLDWFGHMIEHNWFRCPLLALAFAASVHITDVRPALLHGMRNLGLTLLAWLLPLVVVLGWGFLLGLVFTGLTPLWGTRFAASILLWAVVVTLVLLNAAYKDGDQPTPAVIRWAGRVAPPMMLLMTLLATYAIAQRVGQYGWTPMRLRSAMAATIGLIYAAGYTRAAVLKGPWLKGIEPVNIAASLGIVAVLVLKLTPIADPARISVNSQVARLTSGKLAAAKFDYQFLRFNSGGYGTNALAALAGSSTPEIAMRARQAQVLQHFSYSDGGDAPDPAQTEPAFTHASVYPKGARLPDGFRKTKWADSSDYFAGPDCMKNGAPCDVIVLPGKDSGAPLLLVIDGPAPSDQPATAKRDVPQVVIQAAANTYGGSSPVYGLDANGKWAKIGALSSVGCAGVREALRRGEAVPSRPLHDDIIAGGQHLTFTVENTVVCPPASQPRATPTAAAPVDASAPSGMGPAFGKPGGL
ncbi:DUF4153 domain-containing protein [Novosphingobium sp. AAP1]|uniref:DUF4153 domain-containing protein n=1 Tax=Novosphingobium sp. AAP1 TaxID=1523413 RepID=UPI0009EA621B|nr:DUF4153 domain-containing protein [Novosphingobium sp. AAP1]